MKELQISFTFSIMLLLLIPFTSASMLQISVEPNTTSTYTNELVTYNLTIKNNQEDRDNFQIFVSGKHMEWFFPRVILKPIDANSSETVKLNFYPLGDDVGEFIYNIYVSSQSKPEIKDMTTIKLITLPDLVIKDFSAEKAGNELNIELELDGKKQDVDVFFYIKDSTGKNLVTDSVKETFSDNIKISRKIVLLEKMIAGSYIVSVSVKSNLLKTELTDEAVFAVEPIHNVVETTERVVTPLYEEITVFIENQGNLVERDYSIYQKTPSNFLTGFITKPSDCYQEMGSTVCKYVVGDIAPDEKKEISYRIEYWPMFMQYALVIIVVALIIVASFFRAAKPTIKKKHIRKGANRYNMFLEIKNPFLHNLNNVIVRDWVSPLATVMQREFETVKPIMRRSEAGTELIWKLGDVKPNENRILNYKLKTHVEGNIKMPRAYMRFKDKSGKTTRIYSKGLEIGKI